MLNKFSNRQEMIKHLPKHFKIGVEVGVRTGWFSKFILDNSSMFLYCVDPWERNAELEQDPKGVHKFCINLLKDYTEKNRCELIKGYSPQVCENFENESLDFVYIDALHDYDSVLNDIKGWYPKVKKGGIISGHDYDRFVWPGVFWAVNDFFSNTEHEIQIVEKNTTPGYVNDDKSEFDGHRCSWYVQKC